MTARDSKSKSIWVKITIGFVLALIVLFVGVLIPATMSNGLEKLQGKERIEAHEALQAYISQSTTGIEKIGSIGVFKYRVERVEKNEDGAPGACEAEYKVFISERTFFGLHPEPRYALNCQ